MWRFLRFWIDLVSVLPFEIIGEAAKSDNVSLLKIMRVIRVMRLLKLMRIVRASRIFERWESSVVIRYSYLGLIKFSAMLLIVGHWMACTWCLVASVEPTRYYTWVDGIADTYYCHDRDSRCDADLLDHTEVSY